MKKLFLSFIVVGVLFIGSFISTTKKAEAYYGYTYSNLGNGYYNFYGYNSGFSLYDRGNGYYDLSYGSGYGGRIYDNGYGTIIYEGYNDY